MLNTFTAHLFPSSPSPLKPSISSYSETLEETPAEVAATWKTIRREYLSEPWIDPHRVRQDGARERRRKGIRSIER
jgi:hypothetical protein